MWIRVALNKNDIHHNKSPNFTYVEGKSVKEFYFDEDISIALEKTSFLQKCGQNLPPYLTKGDCDYFDPDKWVKFKQWLLDRLTRPTTDSLKNVYKTMLEMANIAIEKDAGISFDL